MSFLNRVLTLSAPTTHTAEQTAALDALKRLNERIDAELMAMPDPKEELAEEQDDWVKQWDALMDESVTCLTEVGRVGIQPRLKTGIIDRMQKIEECVKDWQEAAKKREAERLQLELERAAMRLEEERAARNAEERATRLAEERAAREKAMGSSHGSSPIMGSSGSTTPSPVEMKHMQPKARMTVLPHNRIPPIAPALAQKESKESEPDKSAPAPTPAAALSNNTSADGIVVHRVPCDKCQAKKEECRGLPDRTCERCGRLKAQCNKSLGRGKAKAAVEEEKGLKAKGKVPARPARMAKRKPFPNPPKNSRKSSRKVITLDSSGDEDTEGEDGDEVEVAPPRKKAKTSHPEPGAEDIRVAGVLALKQLKGKIFTMQGRIKSAEAELGRMGIEMGRLVREFADVEVALGM